MKSIGKVRRTRAEHIQEAQEIYAWLIYYYELADNLIRASTKSIKDNNAAADARLDLSRVAWELAAADSSKFGAIWQGYQRHFIGDRNRANFSRALRLMTGRIGSAWLVSFGQAPDANRDEVFRWDSSLLPRSVAGNVLRLATLHPGVLENFLLRFFVQASDRMVKKSTYRRKMRILQNVPRFGWSEKKHTAHLLQVGDLDPSLGEEAVKKLIRDLRQQYQKFLQRGGRRPKV